MKMLASVAVCRAEGEGAGFCCQAPAGPALGR